MECNALNLLLRLTLDSRNYYYDEELEDYEVVVDETKFGKKTGYGIHISKLHQINYFNCIEEEQELHIKEYCMYLKNFP
jgi:hypothetical protein